MRTRIGLILVVLVILAALGVVPQVRSADNTIAPRVVETIPTRGEELPVEGSVTFYFDQPMDRASVEAAFKVTPAINGKLSWDNDLTAVFKPNSPFKRATEYTFTIGQNAKSEDGAALRDVFSVRLNTPGALLVVQILPANNAEDVEATPTITVMFNRPVVALKTIEEMEKLPSPITISPAVQGKGEWLNTSIYTFKPTTPLAGGSRYTVTVKRGLTDITGSVLEKDVSASFTTVPPRVIEVVPEENDYNQLREAKAQVWFSQPMNTQVTQGAITLVKIPGNRPVAVEYSWDEGKYKVTLKPQELLDYASTYEVRVDRTKARSATGGLIQADVRNVFTTIQTPDIDNTLPRNGDDENYYGGFTVYFTAPMDLKDFKDRITIDPKPEQLSDQYVSVDSFSYNIGFGHQPSTNYTIKIDTNGLKDKYGTPIELDPKSKIYEIVAPGVAQIKFSTQAYPAEASLKTGSFIGLYSAYRETTRVFSTHRNISSLELGLYKLDSEDFFRLAGPNSYEFRESFKPSEFLRRWTVPVDNPPNVLRYDLLTISEQGPSLGQGRNVICVGAPASRLSINDNIVVLRSAGEQRIRETAGLRAEILGTVKPRTRMTITGGPICADGFVWWEVKVNNSELSGWTAEADGQQYFIGSSLTDDSTPAPVPTLSQGAQATATANASAKTTALKPGLYWLEFSSPELYYYDRPLEHMMIVATANITLKLTPHEAIAWVTDLESGKPLPDVEVSFYNGNFAGGMATVRSEGKVKTDENGLARYRFPKRLESLYTDYFAEVNDGKNFGLGMTEWNDGLQPWEFEISGDYDVEDTSVYLYTERALYRPGQPVYFRGVLRSRDDVTYTLADRKTVFVEVFDNEYKSIYAKDVPVTPFGTFADSLNLDPDAPLGYYTISVRPDTTLKDRGMENRRTYSHGFNVAEYRVPEFKVAVTAAAPDVLQGDTINVDVNSSYFFGGALSNANVTWAVRAEDYYFSYQGEGYYDFIDYNYDAGPSEDYDPYGRIVAEGEGTTNDQGIFTIKVPASLDKKNRSQHFTVEASVRDESGQVISGRAEVIVHQGEYYIGLRPQEYVSVAKQPSKIDVISVDWDSKPKPRTDIAIKVVERVWSSVQTVEPGTGRTVWNYDVKENPITDGVVQTDDEGKAVYEFTPPKSGIYKIYATSRDSKGNQITTSTYAWIAGEDYVPWRQQNSNRIDLKIDKDSYKVGDTASILVASPFQGDAIAWITVERGGILKTEMVTMTTNSYIHKVPITPDMAPNAFVSVVVVKGVDEHNPVAAFRMGMVQFDVETERLKLNIEITPDKPQAGPREKVNYTVKVTDYAGKPVQAEVGVSLVDQAVLSLLDDQSRPILQYFYGQKGLTVKTASSLVLSVDQQTQEILSKIKGGGGGGPEGGIFEVRQEFVTTPLWAPTVTTNENGEAVVSVTLPDNLTTWRLDARAVTQPIGELSTTLVGQTTFDLLSTKPVLIRPVTPRFYVVGDQSTLAAIVNNNTDQEQEVEVSIETTGVTLTGNVMQTGKIPARGRLRFAWPIEVEDVNAVGVTFYAKTTDNKYTDAAKSAVGQGDDKTLPVIRYEVPEVVGTAGMIGNEGGERVEGVVLPRRFEVKDGTLSVRIDASLAASTIDALEVLRTYPYHCIEQTVSRFLPNLMSYRAFVELGIDNEEMKKELANTINFAVQRLYAEQHVDGGWGWFVRDDSNPLVTAYALIGLYEADTQGFNINASVISNATRFVASSLKNPGALADRYVLNREAFLLYTLARVDEKRFYSNAVNLFKIREKMSLYARAFLAMAFNYMQPDETTYTDTLLSDINNRAAASATGIHWEEEWQDWYNWNTDTRTAAIILNALVQIQPKNELIPNAIRWLMMARRADSWETTQESAWAVMALTSWMKNTGELKPDYSFNVSVNDKSLAADRKVTTENVREAHTLELSVRELLTDQVNMLLINRSGGAGNLYYTTHLKTYLPAHEVKAASRGISITRSYSLLDDKERKPITQAKVGDVVRVTLTIVIPNDLHYVIITDPLPAGAEAIDPKLATSAIGQRPRLQSGDPLSRGWGWWWFSETEMRDEKVVMYATYLPQGTYTYTYSMRAGLEGKYRVIPAWGQEFYFPEVYGRSDGNLFTITPAE